ncbi:MAG TPA: LCP family protein [Candidatus Merdiplasma excrementigallinarum]|uniref:LCP family protein n=1 Tax=Candidatus Merdiplasma excrementigallinarum TaxID=2840864 RepID=A0A9D1P188_9FIRM|nr:LCP family protein [Candidatus Merdiplasma excrementigallinarum]
MSRRYDDNPLMNHNHRKQGPSWKKIMGISLCIILAIVVAGGVLIYTIGHELISSTNFVADEDVKTVQVEELPEEAKETVSAEEKKGRVLDESELNEIHQQMNQLSDVDTVEDEDVYNLLLVGVDRRDKTWNGNSDSMMLVSINHTAKRVSVVSLMRDTYVDIPGYGYNKLNAAYALGGGPLLTETITDTYKVDVSRYAAVDFENMIQIIDALGGIDLEMTDAEVEVANGYMLDMCNTLGLNGYDYVLPGGGVYHCNGVQAVAYARNRYVGNSDYARTERQRYVISQIIEEVKRMDVAQLTQFVKDVLPLVTHNVEETEIWDLVTKAPEILQYKFVQDRIPYDNMYDVIYVDSQDMLVPQWETTIEKLHNTIYGNGSISDNSDNDAENKVEVSDEFTDDYPGLLDAETETEAGIVIQQ